MSKAVIHIGTHKTATTTIQDTFWNNAEVLKRANITYPRLGRVTGHHGIAHDWVKLPAHFVLPKGSLGTLQELAQTHAHDDTILFLSSEEFSRATPGRQMDFSALKEALSSFDEIEVVCTLRKQWDFIQSIYLEAAKIRQMPCPTEVLPVIIQTGMFEGLYTDFNPLLDRLLEVFEPNQLRFVDYHSASRSEGGLLGAFLTILGGRVAPSDLTPVKGGRSNVSPPALATLTANEASMPRLPSNWLIRRATVVLNEIYGEGAKTSLFTKDELTTLLDHFDGLNETFIARVKQVQPRFDITGPDIDAITAFRDDVDLSFWRAFCRDIVKERELVS